MIPHCYSRRLAVRALILAALAAALPIASIDVRAADESRIAAPNYELAAQWTVPKINKMIFDTQVTPHWLEFSDHQYLDKSDWYSPEDVAPALAAALRNLEPTAVFVPFGLANPDHDLTHRTARLVMNELEDVAWYCYEDAGYCHLPGLLAWRIAALFRSGLWPTPAIVPVSLDTERKHRALGAYRSQLAPLRADHMLDARTAAPVPEQYWRLGRPPDGWEGLADVPG